MRVSGALKLSAVTPPLALFTVTSESATASLVAASADAEGRNSNDPGGAINVPA